MNATNGKSPKERRQLRARKVRRDSIITVAEEAFTTNGYEDTMVDQIAIDADYTKATIYNYFDSKDDLLAAVIARTYDYMYEVFAQALQQPGAKYELRTVGNAYLEFVDRYPRHAELLDSGRCGMISKNIIEKESRAEDLTESEGEYITNEARVSELMMGVISQTLQESGLEGKVDPMKVMIALSVLNPAIREIIRRGTVKGQSKDEIQETLGVLFNIIEQGVKHYDEK